MNISWMTIRDLEYVIAVARYEHFGRAARECHVSQPSLSTQIRKIEGYLGVGLFERTNRRVTTTTAGKVVAEQAARILDEARKIPGLLGQAASRRFDVLKLGVISSLSPFIPYALPLLKKAFPGSSLTLQEAITQDLVRDLKSGGLDAVVAADTVKDEALTKVPLFFEPFVLAAPKGHPILRRAKPMLSDLRASDMVLLDEGHCLRDQALDFCPTNRRGSLREFHATSVETLRHLVASGAGYTLFPALAVRGPRLGKLVEYQKFDDIRVGRSVVLLFRRQAASAEFLQRLSQTLARAVPKSVGTASQA